MRIWPAIDLKGGNCVRLTQGDYYREMVYGKNPSDMAARWVSEGATGLHVIDLDGALGIGSNISAITQICNEVDIEIQVGGGIRSEEVIEQYLSLGIKRLIISTKSVEDPGWLMRMTSRYENHLVVSIDIKNEGVAFDGWQKTTDMDVVEHARAMAQLPIAGLIVTDITRAGMLNGPNYDLLNEVAANINRPLISSGGVRHEEDVERLAQTGIHGCVIGKALYEGKLTLPQTISAANAAGSQTV